MGGERGGGAVVSCSRCLCVFRCVSVQSHWHARGWARHSGIHADMRVVASNAIRVCPGDGDVAPMLVGCIRDACVVQDRTWERHVNGMRIKTMDRVVFWQNQYGTELLAARGLGLKWTPALSSGVERLTQS